MDYEEVKHTFNPIYDCNSKIIILGSFPSIKSRNVGFYYGHKQNRFWKILSALYNIDFTIMDNDEKTKELLNNKIALYDVIESCEIHGSSDALIKNEKFNKELINIFSLVKFDKIILNGKKAYSIFMKNIEDYKALIDIENVYCLPSTSAANAVESLDRLIEKWKIIKE